MLDYGSADLCNRVFGNFLERCPAVQLASDCLGGDAADRGLAETY